VAQRSWMFAGLRRQLREARGGEGEAGVAAAQRRR
jgi:hypothetical protein